MPPTDTPRPGRHWLHIPGPTPIPEAVERALARPTIDHRSAEFSRLTLSILERLRPVFATDNAIAIYPASGTGAWEAALVNTLSSGDRVLFCDNGHFATLWSQVAERLGLEVETLGGDWRHPVDPARLDQCLRDDSHGRIRAVVAVHNETSTGVLNDVGALRRAIDDAGHEALFLVDAVSSLAATEFCHDDWRVDVTVAGAQKGLMLPPGLGLHAISDKALAAAGQATLARSYWDWAPLLEAEARGFFPYTPATNLLFGLDAALDLLHGEGLAAVFARHERLAAATRQAVRAWELELYCACEAAHSPTLTTVAVPESADADRLRRQVLERFDLSLGTGLGPLQGRVFRVGHLGSINDLQLAAALCGIEMGLALAGVPHRSGGVQSALDALARSGVD
jgi:alanine-glyoxylate transaminase/serine-glyoxylate transaminase/serine-pyruvate transaminase